jgi:hypothetical protein
LWELAGVEGPGAEKGFSMMTSAMKKQKKELEKQGKKFASSRHLPAVKSKKKN